MKKSVLFLTTALVLLVVFSGCGEGTTEPPSISITVSGINANDLPHVIRNSSMAGFTVSLIEAGAQLTIDYNVGPMDQRTVLAGTTAESVIAYFSDPPTGNNISLTFKVLLTGQFIGSGNYAVVLGASDDYAKYNKDNPTAPSDLYQYGKMFITKKAGTTDPGTVAISDGVIIPWGDFLKNPSPGDDKGYSADKITDMFPFT